ncbi:MAG: GFA family protein [Pseudomonadota bacterium]
MPKLTGKCLCGAVAFEADADKDDVTACHCSQCRRWSGHYWASINVAAAGLIVTTGEESLKWHRSSAYARRGFCRECGSALFWHADLLEDHKARIAISAGSLDAPANLHLALHIFVADKGDYYDIKDGLPQKETH